MQSEEFDKKVAEAADHHHPAYDENAWARMEKLLDKHLPQEKERKRRIFFFFLLFLLLGGGAWILISKPWKENKQVAAVKPAVQKTKTTIPVPVSEKEGDLKENNFVASGEKDDNIHATDNKIIISNPQPGRISVIPGTRGKNTAIATTIAADKRTKNNQAPPGIVNESMPTNKDNTNDWQNNNKLVTAPSTIPALTVVTDQKNKEPVIAMDTPKTVTNQEVNEPANKINSNNNNPTAIENPATKKNKNKIPKSNSFFFTLSAGPDISVTANDKPGTTKLLTGGGLGFTFKDKLTIRTGFYAGRKIYTSSPASYHPPANFWTYYPNLEKVDADCKVYEIPLSLSYNFGHSSKQKWFASAGLSSLLMKRETYTYFYKTTATGPTVSRKWTIRDQNKHYFSVLTLSGGFQKNIGKSVSVTIEPYVKLPLSGIGYGKVKLNSGGVLFSVGIKPFGNSKNSNNSPH